MLKLLIEIIEERVMLRALHELMAVKTYMSPPQGEMGQEYVSAADVVRVLDPKGRRRIIQNRIEREMQQ